MKVRQIVEAYLKENGFDGLFNTNGECACVLDDLVACGELSEDCQAGYKKPCDEDEDGHTWIVSAEKP